MKTKNEEELQYFAPLYILNKLYPEDGLTNPEKYKNDPDFISELQKLQSQDESLINEISQALIDKSGKYDNIWNKVNELIKTKETMTAENGAKLEYLKSLNSYKKGKKMQPKKCKCGCDMIDVKDEGGKITSKCSCNCGGGKVKIKEKGGILDKLELQSLVGSGVIDSSIENK
jgi:hypothetical protein